MHLLHSGLHHYGYLAAFVLAFLSAGYLPVPGALVGAAVGGLIGSGAFNPVFGAGAVLLGGVCGDCGRYWIARGVTSQRTWDRRDARFRGLHRLEQMLKTRPLATIALSRFVPIAKGAVDSLSGMSRFAPARFLLADVLGNLLYAGVFLSLGVVFGRAWGDVHVVVTAITCMAFLMGAATVAGVLLFPGAAKAGKLLPSDLRIGR